MRLAWTCALLAFVSSTGCSSDSAPETSPAAPDPSAGGPSPADFGCPATPPSSEVRYESRFQSVLGANMHYYESGPADGPVVLLLHGLPVSAYFWRNVIPHLEDQARVIALDHIGFGLSDRPEGIDYGLVSQVAYLDGFVEALGLTDVVVVGQDMGSWVGMTWASQHPDQVRAVALVEGLIPPLLPAQSDTTDPNLLGIWMAARDPVEARRTFIEENFFLETVLPGFTACGLPEATLAHYAEPWADPESRSILYATPAEIPIDGQPAALVDEVETYVNWIESSPIPKLLVHAEPGALMPPAVIETALERMPNVTATSVGGGIHFLAESKPDEVGKALSDWLDTL